MPQDKRAVPSDPNEYEKIVALVKASVHRWPNAYASGQVVQQYKAVMEWKGKAPYVGHKPDSKVGLVRWYNEKWVDLRSGSACGTVRSDGYYPTCRPSRYVTAKTPVTDTDLSTSQKKQMIKAKQAAKEKRISYPQVQQVLEKKKDVKSKATSHP